MRLASMRTKTMNRNPTTAARPTSHGFRWRSVAVQGGGGRAQKWDGWRVSPEWGVWAGGCSDRRGLGKELGCRAGVKRRGGGLDPQGEAQRCGGRPRGAWGLRADPVPLLPAPPLRCPRFSSQEAGRWGTQDRASTPGPEPYPAGPRRAAGAERQAGAGSPGRPWPWRSQRPEQVQWRGRPCPAQVRCGQTWGGACPSCWPSRPPLQTLDPV